MEKEESKLGRYFRLSKTFVGVRLLVTFLVVPAILALWNTKSTYLEDLSLLSRLNTFDAR